MTRGGTWDEVPWTEIGNREGFGESQLKFARVQVWRAQHHPNPGRNRDPHHCPRQLLWAEAAGIPPSPGLPKSPCPLSLTLGTAAGTPPEPSAGSPSSR